MYSTKAARLIAAGLLALVMVYGWDSGQASTVETLQQAAEQGDVEAQYLDPDDLIPDLPTLYADLNDLRTKVHANFPSRADMRGMLDDIRQSLGRAALFRSAGAPTAFIRRIAWDNITDLRAILLDELQARHDGIPDLPALRVALDDHRVEVLALLAVSPPSHPIRGIIRDILDSFIDTRRELDNLIDKRHRGSSTYLRGNVAFRRIVWTRITDERAAIRR